MTDETLEKIKNMLIKAATESKEKTDCETVAEVILRYKRVK